MTLYEVLSIATPVIVIIFGGMMGYILKTITESIARLDGRIDKLDSRIDNIDSRIGHLEKEVYFIKGLIEGKNLSK